MSDTPQGYNLRTFYTLVVTQMLSLIGSQISSFAIGIWIFNDTGDATPLALIAFFSFLPRVLLPNVAGVMADRYDRRYVMALADSGQAVATVAMLILFLSGDFSIWLLYLIVAVQACFAVFQGPAFSASITMLVPDDQRDRANTIRQLTGPTAGIIAPAVAGVLYGVVGVVGAIAIDITTFIISMIVLLLVHIPKPRKTEDSADLGGSFLREMVSGFTYLWQRKSLFYILLVFMTLNFVMGAVSVLLTPYLLSRVDSEAIYGLLMGLFNGGMIVGGIVFSVTGGTKRRIHVIMPGIIISGLMTILIGMAQTPVILGIVLLLMPLTIPAVNSTFMSMLQKKVAPDVQGRVFATMGQLTSLIMPLAYLMSGPLADNVFEPLRTEPVWATFAPVFGTGEGAGIGLMFALAGLLVIGITSLAYAVPLIRDVEESLPDFDPQPADDDVIPDIATT
jgi:MFS family permease